MGSSFPLGDGLFDASDDCVKVLGLDGSLISMNGNGQCLMEIDDFEPLRGASWPSLWPEQERDTLWAALNEALHGRVARFRADCPTAKGTPKSWHVIVAPTFDEAGKVAQVLSISRDITRERAMERQSERHLRQMESLATAALEVTRESTLDGVLAAITRAAKDIIGAHQAVVSLTNGGQWRQSINSVALSDKYSAWEQYAAETDGTGIYAVVCEENRPIRLTQEQLEYHPRWRGFGSHGRDHPPMRGWLAAPLIGREERNLGLIQLSDKADGGEFDATDEAMLVQLAQLASAAVEQTLSDIALRGSEERFRAAVEAVEGVVWTNDAEGRMTGEQPGWQRLTGQTEAEYKDYGWSTVVHPEDAQPTIDAWNDAVAEKKPFVFEHRLKTASGEWRLFAIRAIATFDERGKVRGWVGVHTDITKVRNQEMELKALNQELEQRVCEALAEQRILADIVEATDAVIQVLDKDFNFIAMNAASVRATEQSFGITPEIGDNVLELLKSFPDQQQEARDLWGRALSGEAFTVTKDFGDPALSEGHYELKFSPLRDDDGNIIAAFGFIFDVTQRVRDQKRLQTAEEQLRQAQKMEAVGQLTGGVAHDFNNMLAVVSGSLELLDRRTGEDDGRAKRLISAALEASKRAGTLTQRLLAFSRQQPLKPEVIDANKLVSGMSDLFRHSLGTHIQLETVLSGGLWRIHADQNQLENVLLNLAVNARDAMPDGGKLTIETQNAHLDQRYAAREPGILPGQYVLIAVTDTGSGMPAEVIAKAFDPFFTTKEVGKGTGLGLSQVYGFVKQSGGHIKIYSEVAQGTTIKIYLPRHAGALNETDDAEAHSSLPQAEQQELILVVDDEDLVREFSVEALKDLGYRVLEASSAQSALTMIIERPDIDLLFTDIVMPEMNGRKLADLVKDKRPDLPIIYTTGYTRNAVVHNGVLDAGVELIGKPFTMEELATRVRDVLDANFRGNRTRSLRQPD